MRYDFQVDTTEHAAADLAVRIFQWLVGNPLACAIHQLHQKPRSASWLNR